MPDKEIPAASEITDWKKLTDEEWKARLSPLAYDVTRHEGTERAFTGKYNDWKKNGTFVCIGCKKELFSSENKFDSGSGWPSFWQPLDKDAVGEKKDSRYGMTRIEVHCPRCEAHLGHVFDDGPAPTGQRYCINSVALDFVEKE